MMPPDSNGSDRQQLLLVAALRNPAVFGAECERVTVLETHISWVLLTGRHAYKIKKAVDLGFLDFTTLAARHRFCAQEVALNRRLAPDIYLDVVAITGSVAAPVLDGNGPTIEYAVRMREFPQDALASRLLARGELSTADIDALAAQVAAFHAAIAVAPRESAFGRPEVVLRIALQNFAQIRPRVTEVAVQTDLDRLQAWTEREHAAREAIFRQRLEHGFIRECHGDLHLGNIARIDGTLTIFDCIEFNDTMRWIDVMSEIAFTVMDLQDRGRPDLAYRFQNAYLEITGDYAGLAVLRYYLVYRALVRAKVAVMRATQLGAGEAQRAAWNEFRGYLDLAVADARPPRPAIIITHGLSGSGKTTYTQSLLESTGAVRLRTDVERKRLHALGPRDRPSAAIDGGLYTQDATEATYRHVRALTESVVAAGHSAIVDAAFLKRWQRNLLRGLASELRVPFVIIDFTAREATLRERIARRMREGRDASDADLAVLEHQLRTQEPLTLGERDDIVAFDTDPPFGNATAAQRWAPLLARLDRGLDVR